MRLAAARSSTRVAATGPPDSCTLLLIINHRFGMMPLRNNEIITSKEAGVVPCLNSPSAASSRGVDEEPPMMTALRRLAGQRAAPVLWLAFAAACSDRAAEPAAV